MSMDCAIKLNEIGRRAKKYARVVIDVKVTLRFRLNWSSRNPKGKELARENLFQ